VVSEGGAGLTIPDLRSARAGAAPEQPAPVADGAGVLSFGEWDTRSDAIAHALIARGAPAGRPVGGVFSEDADGYPYRVDRESDVIKSGALKVSTPQVEAAIGEVRKHRLRQLFQPPDEARSPGSTARKDDESGR
jgi:acyl-CoA synthetase (AMP-forming)/AMP-acid ligase II